MAAKEYFDYEDFIFNEDQWMMEVAFPLFDEISNRYGECSVDLVSFDCDLNDLETVLAFVKKEEGCYLADMDNLVGAFSAVNYELDGFEEQVSGFDESLVQKS